MKRSGISLLKEHMLETRNVLASTNVHIGASKLTATAEQNHLKDLPAIKFESVYEFLIKERYRPEGEQTSRPATADDNISGTSETPTWNIGQKL